MVVLIAGATHTGKTTLAQKLLEKYKYPYLSLDHLKMGMIRSGYTALTVQEDNALTDYLWPIVKEIVKTAVENRQNLIIEGIYIPFDWKKDFENAYLKEIRYCCLIMSNTYIKTHFKAIQEYAGVIEKRKDDACNKQALLAENARNLAQCQKYGLDYILIDAPYRIDIDL